MQTIRVRTTQNVFIDHPLAGIGDRVVAFLLDRLILLAYAFALFGLMARLNLDPGDRGMMWMIAFVAAPFLLYSLVFEIFMNGQTPGKRVLRIQVVRLDGTPATVGDYMLRWILGFVDFYMLGGAIAVITIIAGAKGQRLGDIVAGTTVVKLVTDKDLAADEKFIVGDDAYTPTFGEAAQLSARDIEVIQRALEATRDHANLQPVEVLTAKVKEMLGVKSNLPPAEFLRTIVKDYNSLTAGR